MSIFLTVVLTKHLHSSVSSDIFTETTWDITAWLPCDPKVLL